MMTAKDTIIKHIERISGKYSKYEVFSDWIRCMALSISNSCSLFHDQIWKNREQDYLSTITKYDRDEYNRFPEMMTLLADSLETEMEDVLGDIFMKAGMGSSATGQFFTPFHLSELCARCALEDYDPANNEPFPINEPSCGGGSMIIAVAKVLKEKGVNYQKVMKVVAQDLDWKGVHMCYVQLSLLGIDAICVQGDTLREPFDPHKTDKRQMLFTPRKMGVLI